MIPPGQEGQIIIQIDADKVHGSFKKNATIYSNDPKHPIMTISIKGELKKYIEIKPSDRVYLTSTFGETVEKELLISSNEKGLDLRIENISSNIDDKITYKVVPAEEPGTYKLKLWKNPRMPVTKTWGSLTLYTNSERSPKKIIQINVSTKSLITAQPSVVNFGRVSPNPESSERKTYRKTLTLSKAKGTFRVKNIAFSSDFYSAQMETLEDGKKYSITVSFTPSSARRVFTDEMLIYTDDPLEPVVRIRMVARTI